MDQKQERITTIHDFNLDPAILKGRLNLVSELEFRLNADFPSALVKIPDQEIKLKTFCS